MKQKYTTSPGTLVNHKLPELTDTYVPVPNIDLLKGIIVRAKDIGLEKKFARYRATDSGIFSGSISFQDPGQPDADIGFEIAFVNSYNKAKSLMIAAGANVFVCDNGMIIGDITMIKRHQGNVIEEMNNILDLAFEQQTIVLQEAREFKKETEKFTISKRKVSHILGELFYERNFLSPNELSAVVGNIKESPDFRMHTPTSTNVWNLYNNITEVLKNVHPTKALHKDKVIHTFFKGELLGDADAFNEMNAMKFDFTDLSEEYGEIFEEWDS